MANQRTNGSTRRAATPRATALAALIHVIDGVEERTWPWFRVSCAAKRQDIRGRIIHPCTLIEGRKARETEEDFLSVHEVVLRPFLVRSDRGLARYWVGLDADCRAILWTYRGRVGG